MTGMDWDTDDDFKAIAPVVSKLIGYHARPACINFLSAIARGVLPIPCMESFYVGIPFNDASTSTLLSHGDTPGGLKELSVNVSSVAAEFFNYPILLARLTKLELEDGCYHVSMAQLSQLSCLESLLAPLPAELLAELFGALRSAFCLRKLITIQSTTLISGDSLETIPSQIEELQLTIETPGIGITDHLRHILQSATQLKSLTLQLPPNHQRKAAITIINALPPNLTHFGFIGSCAISPKWSVIFPTKLKFLAWLTHSRSKDEPETSGSPLCLPPTLESLTLPNRDILDQVKLPPYLSNCHDFTYSITYKKYFDSRKHPNPALADSHKLSICNKQ